MKSSLAFSTLFIAFALVSSSPYWKWHDDSDNVRPIFKGHRSEDSPDSSYPVTDTTTSTSKPTPQSETSQASATATTPKPIPTSYTQSAPTTYGTEPASTTCMTISHRQPESTLAETDADVAALLGKALEIMISATDDNQTAMDSTPDSNVTEQATTPTTPKNPIECCDKPEKGNHRFNPNCELIASYDLVQRQGQSRNEWAVSFHLKNALHRTFSGVKVPTQYVVKYWRTNVATSGDVHFLSTPYSPDLSKITIGNLRSGDYAFQVCAATASFQPSFVDGAGFSWEQHSPTHRLRLHPNSEKQEKAAPVYHENNFEYAW